MASRHVLTPFSTLGRAPFDAPYHTQPAPVPVPNRLSLAPRNRYHHSEQEPRTLNNADNHFRIAQNLRDGMPLSSAPPRSYNTQRPGPMALQRNALFSQQQTNSQSLDSIDQLANAMLMQKSLPPVQMEPAQTNDFRGLPSSRVNQLQPQLQQVTPPFNLSMKSFFSLLIFGQRLTDKPALRTVLPPMSLQKAPRLLLYMAQALQPESAFDVLRVARLQPQQLSKMKTDLRT